MAHSIETLITQFRIQNADTEEPYLWSDDQVAILLNEAEREFAARTEIFKDTVVVDVDPHEMPYVTLPTDAIRFRRVKMEDVNTPLEIVNFNELDGLLATGEYGDELTTNWETVTGTPRMFVVDEVFGKARLTPQYDGGVDETTEEMLTNPDFDTATTGWTDGTTGTATATVVAGELVLDYGSGGGARVCFIDQEATTVAGETYTVTVNKTANNSRVYIGTTQGASDIFAGGDNAIDVDEAWVATGTSLWVRLENPSGASSDSTITSASVLRTIEHVHSSITLYYVRYPATTITADSVTTELTDTRHQMALLIYAKSKALDDTDSDTYDPVKAVAKMAEFDAEIDKLKGELTRKTRRPGTVRYGGL